MLIEETLSKKRDLTIFPNTNHLVKLDDQLKILKNAQQSFNFDEDCGSYHIGKELTDSMSDAIKQCINSIQCFIQNHLSAIHKSISNHNFQQTINLMQEMKSQFEIAETHLDDSTKILVSKLDHDLQAHILETVQRFKQLEISEYLIKRPKNLV